jgi:thiol-disulfide isomerase/thioredoxin
MATPSTMLPLGTTLPAFDLLNPVTGATVSSASLAGPAGVLVAFICNHCPYVVHVRQQLVAVAHAALEEGFSVVAINSNSIITHPEDGPGPMTVLATGEQWRFPFLYDETQAVAKAFRAACTPDLYLFDARRELAYRGQFDDSRPGNGRPVTGKDLRDALAAVKAGKAPSKEQKASIGCGIKWHPPQG